jgi:FKBP-type peptidyl-prolyl cis-trans isomerase
MPTTDQPTVQVTPSAPISLPSEQIKELKVVDVKPGDGKASKHGDQLEVHYTGWLYDPTQPENKGNKFDSSRDRGEPFKFRLGASQVIPGWDKGLEGMKIGGQRQLIIPSSLGYGVNGAGAAIPPNATLLFEIELLKISP